MELLLSHSTPLHMAVMDNNMEIVRFLMESIPREKLCDLLKEGKVIDYVIADCKRKIEPRVKSNVLSFLTCSEETRLSPVY